MKILASGSSGVTGSALTRRLRCGGRDLVRLPGAGPRVTSGRTVRRDPERARLEPAPLHGALARRLAPAAARG